MKNKTDIIDVKSGDENCPADALMSDFRKRANSINRYPKNVEFSKTCINFFKYMVDLVEEYETYIYFRWEEVVDLGLPSLIVKIRKNNGKYYLQYLKEIGKEKTIIKCKQRKGKNKLGKKIVNKEDDERGER